MEVEHVVHESGEVESGAAGQPDHDLAAVEAAHAAELAAVEAGHTAETAQAEAAEATTATNDLNARIEALELTLANVQGDLSGLRSTFANIENRVADATSVPDVPEPEPTPEPIEPPEPENQPKREHFLHKKVKFPGYNNYQEG